MRLDPRKFYTYLLARYHYSADAASSSTPY